MKRLATFLFVGSLGLVSGTAAFLVPPLLALPAAAQSGQQGLILGTPPGNPDQGVLGGDRFEVIARQILPAVVSVEAIKQAKGVPGSVSKGKPVEESGSGVIVQMPNQKG